MKYYSTNNKAIKVSLREAVMQGLAPDNGLFMPEVIPQFSSDFFKSLQKKSFQQIALEVTQNLIGIDLHTKDLERIVSHTIQFDAPLIEIEKNIHSLELFHGPTSAFKDFGARFLSGLLGHFASQQNEEITILVATSGDTGSAVANGFLNVPGTNVIVLYPSGKVSAVQEKQFTTLGGNVRAIEVDGTFDDCQRLVKQCFSDKVLNTKLVLTSANSINIARLIPQSFYYFYAYAQLKTERQIIVSVPSGNFGNLTAGLMARRMGLPVKHFVAATNTNDIVPEYLKTHRFNPRPSVQTISNAMDVGNPSNFFRIVDLFDGNVNDLTNFITGYSFTDQQTTDVMKKIYKEKKYVLDPHGAIGYLGLKEYLRMNSKEIGVFLETAHPAKFQDVVSTAIGESIPLPPTLEKFMAGKKLSTRMSKEFEDFKSFLLN
ncbi:MAG: threonine synthase [Bacteroidia bacterium]|nr:threonine synthase [Bacteroidia bacterium]